MVSTTSNALRQTGTLALSLLLASACSSTTDPQEPSLPQAEPRTFAMGWSVTPPRLTTESVLATAQLVVDLGEVTLMQSAPPWTKILAGEPIDELVEEPAGLADYVRALGTQQIVFLVDPLDGLDRRREPLELVEAGRSIQEPEIRALHEAWVRAVVRRIGPEYLGLASEINTLGTHGDPVLYAALVDMINDLAAEVRAAQPGIQVFVSFQVDDAWNLLIPDGADHFSLIDDFDIDALGLSSYPVFVFDEPARIPDDYFSRFRAHTDLPLILVEGGWSSGTTAWGSGSPAEQAAFFRRFEQLMDSVDGDLWVFLIPVDLSLDGWGLPPDRESTLSNFATMGIFDEELRPKPAHEEWVRILGRPLVR